MLVLGRVWRPVAMPVLMAALYVAPAILLVTRNARGYELDLVWILPLLGLILSDRGALEWSLPRRWQWPLITWAAIVAIAWPIVFLREADFALWILPLQRVSNTSIGISPWLVDQNVAYFALIHNFGILWIDALCRWYWGDRERFRGEVLGGLLAAAAVAGLVAVYQGFVDLGFLNEGFWEYMIRASGTLADANKLGAVAAFWTVGALAYARGGRGRWSAAIGVAGVGLGITAVWLSGSRTGLAAVLISVAIAALEALRSLKLDPRKMVMAGGGVLIVGAVLVLVLQSASTHTIVQRGTLGYLPFVGDRGIAESANELLWDRFGYGPSAMQMVKEHPIAGVGMGTYHALSYDYGRVIGRIIPASDNAQAWWRHNFAELGVLGSIPLLVWLFVFGKSLFSASPSGDRWLLGMLRGVLIAFFVASLFGVPAQSMAVVLTFWAFVFWFSNEHAMGNVEPVREQKGQWRASLVAIAAVLIAIHAGMTVAHALGDLRPHNRAQRWDWYYRYGFHTNDRNGADLEPDPGGNRIGRRWTMKDSLAVIPVKGKVLKFVAWIDHPGHRRQTCARASLGRFRARLRRRHAPRPCLPRHPCDAGQDAHGDRDVDRSDLAPERSWQPRYARARIVDPRLGLGVIDLRSQISDCRLLSNGLLEILANGFVSVRLQPGFDDAGVRIGE